MSKLHELLAVEAEVSSAAKKSLRDAETLFAHGRGQFNGLDQTYRPLEEGGATFPPQHKPVAITVSKVLETVKKHFGRWVNLSVEKEVTNQLAQATLEIDGKEYVLAATALLNLEGKLKSLKDVYESIPVLPPTTVWIWNEAEGCYTAPPAIEYRTQKRPEVIVKYQATEHHPAQTELFTQDVRIGEITKVQRSGAITSADKAQKLERINDLLRRVKRARQRANSQAVSRIHIADALFEYING